MNQEFAGLAALGCDINPIHTGQIMRPPANTDRFSAPIAGSRAQLSLGLSLLLTLLLVSGASG
jgi:hypothetical protein